MRACLHNIGCISVLCKQIWKVSFKMKYEVRAKVGQKELSMQVLAFSYKSNVEWMFWFRFVTNFATNFYEILQSLNHKCWGIYDPELENNGILNNIHSGNAFRKLPIISHFQSRDLKINNKISTRSNTGDLWKVGEWSKTTYYVIMKNVYFQLILSSEQKTVKKNVSFHFLILFRGLHIR